MKILNITQLKECDQYTIKNQPIFSINLMEKSAQAYSDWILLNTNSSQSFVIFCGNGNNGGEGLVIARLLSNVHRKVRVYINKDRKLSNDAEVNFQRLPHNVAVNDYQEFNVSDITEHDIIIDAILRIGINKKLSGVWASIVNAVNELNNRRISIDIPSGILPDVISEDTNIFHADDTLSFQFYKKSFLHAETGIFCGKIHVFNTDLSQEYISNVDSHQSIISLDLIKSIYKARKNFSHKGHYGKAILVGGSYGKTGAILLASKAALRSGAGYTLAMAPEIVSQSLLTLLPEAMFILSGDKSVNFIDYVEKGTYGIGPGLGRDELASAALEGFLKLINQPIVLDADAINILAERKNLISWVPNNSILTPHPKEFDRLFGKSQNSFDRLEQAINKALKYKIYIVLKEHHTQIITPQGEVYYNNTGNSGLAKGGSGDVLTGIITALLAQRYTPEEAAIFGVWLHGKSADFALEEQSKESLLASDVIDNLGKVFKFLQE
ncbi:NAD(P)H-hydrate dehydratase [Chryseobacterium sp. T1]